MVNLTSNEEKVRKELMKFPHGVRARTLVDECLIAKSPMYVALNSLENKNLAFRGEHNLWYPENPLEKRIFDNEINLIKEDYVNGLVDKAFKRMILLINSKKSPVRLTKELVNLFHVLAETQKVLETDLDIIGTDPIESGNFERQKRMTDNRNKIQKLKVQIILTALKT